MHPGIAGVTCDPEPSNPDTFEEIARRVREHVIRIAGTPNGCHIGGALSCVEILVTLYFDALRLDPVDPHWAHRDIFIFSKGHAAAALYGVLAERGYLAAEELSTYGAAGSRLLGHPTRGIPGIEFATGSMGHGLSLGVGVALGLKRRGDRERRVFVLVGDGETQEGSVWEAAMAAHHYGLDNLCAIVDRNLGQNDGNTERVIRLGEVEARWEAFGWAARTVAGHEFKELRVALSEVPFTEGLPSVVVAKTVKGRGVPDIEGDPRSHYMTLSARNVERALRSLRRPAGTGPKA
jgi:transketolase